MANTSGRMLRLLSLLQTHRYWPGSELSERLEVSPRTLRRDVDRLRELGYPVDTTRGTGGGYRPAAPPPPRPPHPAAAAGRRRGGGDRRRAAHCGRRRGDRDRGDLPAGAGEAAAGAA